MELNEVLQQPDPEGADHHTPNLNTIRVAQESGDSQKGDHQRIDPEAAKTAESGSNDTRRKDLIEYFKQEFKKKDWPPEAIDRTTKEFTQLTDEEFKDITGFVDTFKSNQQAGISLFDKFARKYQCDFEHLKQLLWVTNWEMSRQSLHQDATDGGSSGYSVGWADTDPLNPTQNPRRAFIYNRNVNADPMVKDVDVVPITNCGPVA